MLCFDLRGQCHRYSHCVKCAGPSEDAEPLALLYALYTSITPVRLLDGHATRQSYLRFSPGPVVQNVLNSPKDLLCLQLCSADPGTSSLVSVGWVGLVWGNNLFFGLLVALAWFGRQRLAIWSRLAFHFGSS